MSTSFPRPTSRWFSPIAVYGPLIPMILGVLLVGLGLFVALATPRDISCSSPCLGNCSFPAACSSTPNFAGLVLSGLGFAFVLLGVALAVAGLSFRRRHPNPLP
ncbi:MAG: hypothetical protein L3K09_04685 [Thermoplasmata archaeon]|nr:hypothetical protein [Thermoplasmata archaeon]